MDEKQELPWLVVWCADLGDGYGGPYAELYGPFPGERAAAAWAERTLGAPGTEPGAWYVSNQVNGNMEVADRCASGAHPADGHRGPHDGGLPPSVSARLHAEERAAARKREE
jgi:hypothetical protein